MDNHDNDNEVAERIQVLRKRSGLSIRQLSGLAGVTPAIISCIERGKNSPSIVTLQKILSALGTDLATFFAKEQLTQDGPVFPREQMRTISDSDRTYTIIAGKQPDIGVEFLDETIRPAERRPPFETLQCDMVGYVLSGSLTLEIKKQPKQMVRPGDAFYIPKGEEHRGFAAGDEPVRIVTVYNPAKY
jgi:transcriptional regulator with XRE-family HTH domain